MPYRVIIKKKTTTKKTTTTTTTTTLRRLSCVELVLLTQFCFVLFQLCGLSRDRCIANDWPRKQATIG